MMTNVRRFHACAPAAAALLAMACGATADDHPAGAMADGAAAAMLAAPHAVALDRWQPRAPLPGERTEVSVTTDGTHVYLVGGFAEGVGAERASAPRAMHVYDPRTDLWTTPDSIPQGVNHAGFAYVAGRLYIVGGFRESSFEPIGNVRIYDIATGQWSEGAPMPTPRGALAVAVLNGRIHAIGGNAAAAEALDEQRHHVGEDDSSVGTHEVYDPATNRWTQLAPMPTPRNHHGAAALGDRIHVIAGRVGRSFEMTTHEIYDPADDAWRAGPPLPTGRSGIAVVVRDGRIYVFGGETFTEPARTFDDAERFDPATGAWDVLAPMPTARHGLGAATVDGTIFVVSGGPGPGFTFSSVNEALARGP
jgi:N-acetylneuraminic acid mutarotase